MTTRHGDIFGRVVPETRDPQGDDIRSFRDDAIPDAEYTVLPAGNVARAAMSQLLDNLFAAPTLPGTILVGVCAAYWLLMILGAVDLDLLDFDLDFDGADVDHGAGGLGMAALKFLNFGDVPLMIWLTFFSASYVTASLLIDRGATYGGEFGPVAAAIARSAAIGLIATKLGTQPLRGRFDIIEPNKAESLVGRTCVITTSDVTDRFGQARVEAEAAPLLLNVRGKPGAFRKNDPALITGYDTERGVFLVEPIPSDHLISEPPHPEAV